MENYILEERYWDMNENVTYRKSSSCTKKAYGKNNWLSKFKRM